MLSDPGDGADYQVRLSFSMYPKPAILSHLFQSDTCAFF